MQLRWTDEQQAFRGRVRDFLARELPENFEELAHKGPASREIHEFSIDFCGKLSAEGLLVPHWPEEWGGSGATAYEHFILGEEMWIAGEPRGGQYMNVNWIGVTLIKYGTQEQKERYVPPMAEGRTLWCQGFSEPGAGSDLASLRTRAERRGDGYRINGQKIWTSYATFADTCFLLARTGEGKAGIAVFLVPMDTPGITVRPIPSLIGEGDIHEVFFDDVDIPETARLGEEGAAWEIITFALSNERVGIPRYALALRVIERAVERLKAQGDFTSELVRGRAARAVRACEAARMMVYKVLDDRARGQPPSPESSVARRAVITAERLTAEFVVEFVPECLADDKLIEAHHQRAIVAGIASGALEIQLNLIANHLLSLPR
ncbi:acyl-CoA dehydrogenase family protein [Amorphus sp. 3PC139-8]|uniref:acyl-CoA dehydrogenase family protein n=1 Tax=Amorphus sp. 3PC139-8 TaxID=2735676 RepID=UPI00345DF44C